MLINDPFLKAFGRPCRVDGKECLFIGIDQGYDFDIEDVADDDGILYTILMRKGIAPPVESMIEIDGKNWEVLRYMPVGDGEYIKLEIAPPPDTPFP